jgi:hypothetical protein
MKANRFVATWVGVLLSSAVAAQKPPAACPLLQRSEIDAAVGAKAGEGNETDILVPKGPAQGQTMTGCMWGIEARGMVSLSVIRAASGAEREAGLAKLREATEALKAQGWTREEKVVGGTHCGTLTPPPALAKQMGVAVGCMGEAKGMAISVSSMIVESAVPPEKIKALFDAAVARLP